MEYIWVAVGIAALFLLNKFVLAPVRRLIVNLVVGLLVLYLVNTYGYLFGFHAVPITVVTGLLIGIFGLPGVLLITLYYTFF
ncbi:pro-sigmaK processing inhibitor BofA family protein [uncultured Megasphaera sp.]|uniref:pro-sigmaK processing inhibitor BofA family protein n=1 Tax=uncultured Megasphaera sp. TaxID=165188 RepID=UPI00265884AB|nr:pro-sigmaK processing inhibitor BofA family protein [uncultured Megasphaera sp.]